MAYRPLNTEEKEIRLLVFENTHPTSPDEVLQCYLQHESLRKAALVPDYYAASYAYGDATKQREIMVGGKVVSVPETAEIALRRFVNQIHEEGTQQDVRPRRLYFWIDSVCINHADQRERSSQLPLMNAIYSEAKAVLIWLGEDEDSLAQDAITSIARVVEQCKTETNDLADLFKRLWNMRARKLSIRSSTESLPPAVNLSALRSFYSSDWFTRLWVIQEACLAQKALCFRGSHTIPLFDVALAAQWMWYRGRGKLSTADAPTANHTIGIRNATEIWDCMKQPAATPKLLWTILAMSMEFECTDPRDKIFGLYGLIELWMQRVPRINFQPNYSMTQAGLYSIATRAAIIDAGNLAILSIACRAVPPISNGKTKDIEMPSWVPRFDWSIDRSRGSTCPIQPPFRGACNGDRVRLNAIDGLIEVLTVEGLLVDEIGRICQLGVSCVPDLRDISSMAPALRQAWETALAFGSRKLCNPLEIAFPLTLCAGQDPSFLPVDDSLEFLSNSASFFAKTEEKELRALGSRISALSASRKDSGSASASAPDASAYFASLSNACVGRNFFVTVDGRLGLGPKDMEPHDRICLLPGSSVPLVLRSKGAFWQFVGDAYCYGLMDGKFYCGLDALGKRHESTQWFHIE